jgi:membrane protease YdiL (CAAX protease family)
MPTPSSEYAAQLLPNDRSFSDSLCAYMAPYLIYVAISSLPETMIASGMMQALKLTGTGLAILYGRKIFRFGKLRPIHALIALAALPAAMLSWIGPFYLLAGLGWIDFASLPQLQTYTALYVFLRLVNSVILVAIFEELFIRVYVMGWLYQAGEQRLEKGIIRSIVHVLDQRPTFTSVLPLSIFSVVGATIVFAAGHHSLEYLSAMLYFLFTTWLYKKSGSLWVCIIVHALTNLGVGLLAVYGGMGWLW